MKRIFIHGLGSSGQGFKGRLLRSIVPDIVAPDFTGTLDERLTQLDPILGTDRWIIVGSSFGGLMATRWASIHPEQVERLVLFAPAFFHDPTFASTPPAPLAVPTVIYHGIHDSVVPLAPVRTLAEQIFLYLEFHTVEDDHLLHTTVQAIDWVRLLKLESTCDH